MKLAELLDYFSRHPNMMRVRSGSMQRGKEMMQDCIVFLMIE